MAKPRETLIDLGTTPYYHCFSRCVRRAFLCGKDTYTGKSYEHRRQWVEDRLLELTQWFCIDIAGYAIMSNHTHVVLHVDVNKAKALSIHAIIERWHGLFAGTALSQRYLSGQMLGVAEHNQLEKQAAKWRERLMSISWFMRCLNESIARLANTEDKCTGRFWEGRFGCQALLDEAVLAAALAYVDLNPIRAKMADAPETSDHTSIQKRIHALQKHKERIHQPTELMPFVGNPRKNMLKGLPFRLDDYLKLVDWTGRSIRLDKAGSIPHHLSSIFDRINIDPESWFELSKNFESHFGAFAGQAYRVENACARANLNWVHGIKNCRIYFS